MSVMLKKSEKTMRVAVGECFYDIDLIFEQICTTCRAAMNKNLISTAVVVISHRTPKRVIVLIARTKV